MGLCYANTLPEELLTAAVLPSRIIQLVLPAALFDPARLCMPRGTHQGAAEGNDSPPHSRNLACCRSQIQAIQARREVQIRLPYLQQRDHCGGIFHRGTRKRGLIFYNTTSYGVLLQ